MTGTTEPTVQRRILDAADEVVRQAGPRPWTMAAVAERALVSRRTLYRYFPTKVDLADALPSGNRAPGSAAGADRYPEDGLGGPGPGSGRAQLLRAAREVFGERGYESTSVREIAERAGLSKLMIYRHFGSKANLYQQATLNPLQEFIATFVEDWRRRPRAGRPLIDENREFFGALFDVLHAQRDLLFPLMFSAAGGGVAGGLRSARYLEQVFESWFDHMEQVMEREAEDRRFRPFDRPLVCRLLFGMVLSVVLHDSWLITGSSVDRDHLAEEMAQIVVYGVVSRR